jgi:hypothetical protein
MRGIFIAILIAFGIVGTSPTLAAPVSGAVIDKATQLGQVAEQAKIWHPRHRRLHHRHHWRRHRWWR